MKIETEVDTNKAIGPYELYDHEAAVAVTPEDQRGAEFFICLDCGYMAHSPKLFLDPECSRDKNSINQTLREQIEKGDGPF